MTSLFKNFIYSVGYQLLINFLPLITTPYISRVLGANGIGEFSYTQSVAVYFSLMAMLGISQHGNRTISSFQNNRGEYSRAFGEIYSVQFITHCISIFVYINYIYLYSNNILSWLQLMTILASMFDISWFYFGIEKFEFIVKRNVLIRVITVILLFLLIKNSDDLYCYAFIMISGTLISQLYLWIFLHQYTESVQINLKNIKIHIKSILILFIPVMAYSIYKVMDKIMLGRMSSFEQVGFYENAYKINNIPLGFITAIGNVMLPRSTALIACGNEKMTKDYIERTFIIFNTCLSLIIFGIAGISSNFAIVYFGEKFEICGSLIMLLNWTVFFISWANIMRTQFLIPYHKDKIYVLSTIVGAILNLIINAMLIPIMKAYGAAIGTLIAEFSVMLIQLIMIRKEISIWTYILKSKYYFFLGFLMMVIMKIIGAILGMGLKSLIMQVLCGSTVFVIGAIAHSYRNNDEVKRYLIDPILEKILSKKY